jgi:hypothetical protein
MSRARPLPDRWARTADADRPWAALATPTDRTDFEIHWQNLNERIATTTMNITMAAIRSKRGALPSKKLGALPSKYTNALTAAGR